MATVRTPQGEQHFDQKMGETILNDDGTPNTEPAGASPVRLRSLLMLVAAAEAVGDAGLAKNLRSKFEKERAIFSEGKTPSEVLAALNAVSEK